jgi:hypothetical protein
MNLAQRNRVSDADTFFDALLLSSIPGGLLGMFRLRLHLCLLLQLGSGSLKDVLGTSTGCYWAGSQLIFRQVNDFFFIPLFIIKRIIIITFIIARLLFLFFFLFFLLFLFVLFFLFFVLNLTCQNRLK